MRFVSLEHLEKADAASVLRAIESAMDKQVGCPWKTKLVGLTTDDAAVMVGKKNGLGALLTRERPQLVTFHCASHRLELAVKSVAKSLPSYEKVNQLLLSVYLFYRNSALNRSNLRNACNAASTDFLVPTAKDCIKIQIQKDCIKIQTARRGIRRFKQGMVPREPATRRQLNFVGPWTTTGGDNPKTFLRHDSGPNTHDRVVVFATDESLRALCRANTWFMDGNFSLAPPVFEQLYVIRAPLGTTCISCVYALLPGKTEAVSRRCWRPSAMRARRSGSTLTQPRSSPISRWRRCMR